MSVRPTVCETLAKGLGRGRSRSARAGEAARRRVRRAAAQREMDRETGRDRFDMGGTLRRRRARIQIVAPAADGGIVGIQCQSLIWTSPGLGIPLPVSTRALRLM